ncbi:MAG TPA: hypothetical protein PLT51_00835 [Candidatus Dojkabacteria bacterium]|nr:hypothetical protein [Candidatus Dojkabacteria bacterium]
MKTQVDYLSSKDYFFNNSLFIDSNNKYILGKNIPDGTDYHIAFSMPRELALKIYYTLKSNYPLVFKHLVHYKTKAGNKVYLGGKFPASYKVKDLMYTLIQRG